MTWSFLREVGRKVIHLTILIAIAGYAFIEEVFSKQAALLTLVGLLLFFLVLEYFRLERGWKMPFFSIFIRPKEQDRLYGVIFFLSATIISLAVFDYKIAIAALFMTTFGDMTAALIGKKYGTSLLYKNKTVVGGIAELTVNLIVGILVLGNIYVAILMAFAATASETIVDELDDNLIIPLVAGFVGQLALHLI